MQAIITGAGGFVGSHLLTHLARLENARSSQHREPHEAVDRSNGGTHAADLTLHGTILHEDASARERLMATCARVWVLDLREAAAVEDMIGTLRPDYIYHLAGQPYVPLSFEEPWDTLDNNVHSTLNILQAVHKLNLKTRVLVVGSADIYGSVAADHLPIMESAPFMPTSPYGVSKIAQEMLAFQYTLAHHLFTVRVRPFNHIGPGQNARFAVPNWASQIAQAEAGISAPILEVGNLSAARDFTDVRDVVNAYARLMVSGEIGEVYNVCSGTPRTMQEIVEILCRLSRTPIEIRVVPERFRAVDNPILCGDHTKLTQRTHWTPAIPIEQTLEDILNEFRQQVGNRVNRIDSGLIQNADAKAG